MMSPAEVGGREGRRGQRAFHGVMDGCECHSLANITQTHLACSEWLSVWSLSAPNSTSCPAEDSWWSGLVIIVAVACASLVFLTVLVIICYKAIKR